MSNRDSDSYSNGEMEDVEPDQDVPESPRPPNAVSRPPRRRTNDEEPPGMPRRQHKYTTANLQPERPWLRYFLICLAFLVMIAIMVLISIFLQKLFDPDEEPDWSEDAVGNSTDDDQAGALTGESLKLPRDSKFIDNVCAEEQLSSDSSACEQVCAPAMDCCNPFSGSNSTCFEEQISGCVTYSQCHALNGLTDPASNDLDRICSVESIEFDPAECELACTSLSCCYTDVDNCAATFFQACLDYSPCLNLRLVPNLNPNAYISTASTIPAAEEELDDQCRDGDPSCDRGCDEATCCSDPNSDCYRDNFLACLTYATCNQYASSTTRINVEPIHTRVPAAPTNLRDICLESYVSSNGRAECEAVCAPADCCFADGVDSCFGSDPLGCMEYRGCSILRVNTEQENT